jgi:hypothetical protein
MFTIFLVFICGVITNAFASHVLIRVCYECVWQMMHNDQPIQKYLPDTTLQSIKHVSKLRKLYWYTGMCKEAEGCVVSEKPQRGRRRNDEVGSRNKGMLRKDSME